MLLYWTVTTEVIVREGYGGQAVARCTQTQPWSPEGSEELVCSRGSHWVSCSSFCLSSSDLSIPRIGPPMTGLNDTGTNRG